MSLWGTNRDGGDPESEGEEEEETIDEEQEEVDGQQLEHTSKDYQTLQTIREHAGTIMTDWQVATALTHLAEMAGNCKSSDSEELKMFYLRIRDTIIRGLPRELQSQVEEKERIEREQNAASLKRQKEAHEDSIRDLQNGDSDAVEVEMTNEFQ